MINNVVLVGRLTKDPELRRTGSNIAVVNFTLAVNRSFADQSGERQADFVQCVVWRGAAENLARYMKQGSLIGVTGSIQTSSYESEQGTRYKTEVNVQNVQFLETRKDGVQNTNNDQNKQVGANDNYVPASENLVDEDLPF